LEKRGCRGADASVTRDSKAGGETSAIGIRRDVDLLESRGADQKARPKKNKGSERRKALSEAGKVRSFDPRAAPEAKSKKGLRGEKRRAPP